MTGIQFTHTDLFDINLFKDRLVLWPAQQVTRPEWLKQSQPDV